MVSSSLRSKHDVFISLRGEDIRDSFASHLSAALHHRHIKIFDDNDLENGLKEMSQGLLQGIVEAKLSVVIFSKNYASSTWNLNELVEMLECRKTRGQIVLPVFYHIDPFDVRNQTGSFATAFDKYEQRLGEESVRKWRTALREAASLAGWNTSIIRKEAALVEAIAQDVERKLNSPRRMNLELALTVTNFILELPSAVFDRLSSKQKPLFALLGMVTSAVSLLLCVVDLILQARKENVRSRLSRSFSWFYHLRSSSKKLRSFSDIVGLVCAVCQLVVTAINYSFIHRQSDSPINISVWPIIFAFGLLCSKLMRKA